MIMKYTFRRELPKADPKVIGGDANSSSFEILSPVLLNNKTRCMLARRMGDATFDGKFRCQNTTTSSSIYSQEHDIVLPSMYSGVYQLPSSLNNPPLPLSTTTALFGLNITLAGASSEALTAWSHTTDNDATAGVPTLWWKVLTVPPVQFFQNNENCDKIKNQFNQKDRGIFFVVNSDKSLSSSSSILPQGGIFALYLLLIVSVFLYLCGRP